MNTSRKSTAWIGVGLLLTMTVGSPVWADDVELLLSTPGLTGAAKPNLLFILDSSGSMTGKVNTKPPFDATTVYPDSGCDADKYYWTTGTSIPACGNKYKIEKTAFKCQQGIMQIAGAGWYTDTMAMYRRRNGEWKWRQPNRNKVDLDVECRADSGVHGDGGTEHYARIGSNVSKYTTDPGSEVDWGVSPTHKIVTMYDGNYLNWHYNNAGTLITKTKIVKDVTKNLLGSMRDVNVGIMHFNGNNGGVVTFGLKDLDANRTAAIDEVDDLPAAGNTPLSETLYEAARYLRGMSADYAPLANTDADALATSSPMVYKQPVEYSCSKNFVVLLTDGLPTHDERDDDYTNGGTWTRLPLMPGYTAATGRSQCTGDPDDEGSCLDDVAEYMAKVDLNPAVDGTQSATTYTIGFDIASAATLLQNTATAGGGKYFPANDVSSLTEVLTEITSDIFNRDISFTAPAVAVNAFNRTQHLNDLYVSVFRAQDEVHWPGNMKKYKIKGVGIEDVLENNAVDPATGYFSDNAKNFWQREAGADGADVNKGGTANVLPVPSLRKVYTNNGTPNLTANSNALSNANIGLFAIEDFGLSGAAEEPSLAEMIEWARGADTRDEDSDADVTESRLDMGDTLHAQPAAVVYGDTSGGQEIVIFTATNDGYLHAINAADGEERWSFVPRELLPNLSELYFNENVDYKNYGLDGDVVPVVYDQDNDGVIEAGTDFVYLIFGMRRGGDNYYMVEVTNPDNPVLRWVRTFPGMGQSWSSPVIAKIDINSAIATSPQDAVVIIGGGYDTVHDAPSHPGSNDLEGASIMMLDLETGDRIWRASTDSLELPLAKMTRSIPSRIRVIDLNGDGFADRMYAADLGGQIWRFDIANGNTPANLVAGGVIARVGAEGIASPSPAETRRLYTTPDVAMFTDKRHDRRYLAINIGSGYRAHPLDNNAADRFYSIRDPHVFTALTQTEYNAYSIIEDDDLTEVSGAFGTVIPADGDGWKLSLPASEKVLSDSQTFDNAVYFVTMEPTVDSDDPCIAGLSINRLYRVDIVNGDPVVDLGEGVTLTGDEADAARVAKLEQGGIAPKPTFFFPSPEDDCTGDECKPKPIGCVGVECFDPGFDNFPVRTLWTQDGIE